jgi:hypothetical protein
MSPTLISDRAPRPVGSILGETLVGASLVLLGIWLVCIALTTQIVARLAETVQPGSPGPLVAFLAWAAMLAAPAGLVLLGTDRLARMVAFARTGAWGRRANPFATLPHDVTIVRGIRLDDGRPGPTLLVGGFGVALVHGVDGSSRRGRRSETREDERAAMDPLEPVTRDAERLRHWLAQREVDFVVRVYAAIVTTDDSLARSVSCAVVTAEQLGAWIGSLPSQRTLTVDRRARLVKILRDAT